MLRSRDRAGAEQEAWALLTVYQALRMAMTAAAGTVPGTDPDRASFTAALETAREQVTAARGIAIPADPGDAGRIGRAVLAGLLPARRARSSARKVKCSTSRFHLRDQDRPELPTVITRVLVTIVAPPSDRPAALPRSPRDPFAPRQPRPETRRDRVTRIMAGQPGRDWAGHDLADMLAIKPRNMLTQLGERASHGVSCAGWLPRRVLVPVMPGADAAGARRIPRRERRCSAGRRRARCCARRVRAAAGRQ